jgi:hypothetical protein
VTKIFLRETHCVDVSMSRVLFCSNVATIILNFEIVIFTKLFMFNSQKVCFNLIICKIMKYFKFIIF